jgi:hypothetical protein
MKRIVCLLLAVTSILVVCGCDEIKESPTSTKTPTITQTSEKTVKKDDITIPNELKTYAKEDLAMSEEELKTAFADFDGDGVAELFQILPPLTEGGANFHIYSLVNGLAQEVIFPADGLEWTLKAISKFEIRKSKNANIIYLTTEYRNGLCGEGSETMLLENKNNVLSKTVIASYSCDTEAEEAKRAQFENIDNLNEAQLKEYIEAHTLKYEANGQKMTKEVYEKVLKDFEAEHELVAKIK